MKSIVIYESKYGCTKRYAQWIAEELSCPVFERKEVTPSRLCTADIVLFGGGLYAGGVSGLKWLIKNESSFSGKPVVLFTCGLADPSDEKNTANIRKELQKVLPQTMAERSCFFHLRGGIDYSRLSFAHKTMMSMLRRMLLSKKPAERSSEDEGILATYGREVDFTDKASIAPIVEYVKALEGKRA